MLFLSFYLVEVFDSDKSLNLICVTSQLSLHHYAVMTVRILESLFDLSYSASFFWRILLFFLNHFKLAHFLWLFIAVRYWCLVWRWSISGLSYYICTGFFQLVVIEVHVLHLSEWHIFHISLNMWERTSIVFFNRCRVWRIVKLLLRPVHHILLLLLITGSGLLVFQIIPRIQLPNWNRLRLYLGRAYFPLFHGLRRRRIDYALVEYILFRLGIWQCNCILFV